MYPGFDIFMGDEAGIEGVSGNWGTYEALFDDPRYAGRLNEHAQQLFNGKSGIEISDEEWGVVDIAPAEDSL